MPKLIVSNPVTDRSLVDLSRVKTELRITTTEHDDLLRNWIRDDSDLVCEVCGVAPDQKGRRTFLSERISVILTADETASSTLILPWRKPVDLADLTVAVSGTPVHESGYSLDADACLLERSSNGFWGGSIAITASAGWVMADIPAALRSAVIRLVRIRWEGRGRDLALKAKAVEGVGREEYWVGGTGPNGGALPGDVLSALQAAGLVAPAGV